MINRIALALAATTAPATVPASAEAPAAAPKHGGLTAQVVAAELAAHQDYLFCSTLQSWQQKLSK